MTRRRGPFGDSCRFALMMAVHAGLWSAQGALAQDKSKVGEWSDVIPLGNVAVHTHVLPTGKVMFWPRHKPDQFSNPDPKETTAKLWDPETLGLIEPSPPFLPGFDLFCSGHAFLPDGRLFVAGGHDEFDSNGLKAAFTYDPAANVWQQQANMNAGRWYPTVVTLPNGEMLVLSGQIDTLSDEPPHQNEHGVNNLPQIWSPSSGWRNLTNARDKKYELYPFLYVAPNGKVFMAGTLPKTFYLNTSGEGAWEPLGMHLVDKPRDYGSSVMYADGKIMVMGGGVPPEKTTEIIDLNDEHPSWKHAAEMNHPRRQLNAAILPDGKVFVSGGSSGPDEGDTFSNGHHAVFEAESWDPAGDPLTNVPPGPPGGGKWTRLAPQKERRLYHSTLVLLPSGQVLSAGGGQPHFVGDDVDHFNGEVYSPPYLFQGGNRPTIASAPKDVAYGANFTVATPDAASIRKVTWIRLSSVTHSFNQNQRINVLAFAANASGLAVTAPADPKLAPPGHYMLFLLDGRGVPSVASIIRVH